MYAENLCPCCSNTMLRHLSNRHSYWYCRSCRIEMPIVEQKKAVKNSVKKQFLSTSIKPSVSLSQNIKTIASL